MPWDEIFYNGIQEGFGGQRFWLYTDMLTKSSFSVPEWSTTETVVKALAEVREQFKEEKKC